MPEEGCPCPCVLRSWTLFQRLIRIFTFAVAISCLLYCGLRKQQQEPPEAHIAELQLNFTGPRKDPTLQWVAGPALGRSFIHGPGMEKGQLLIHRDGIYRLHIQVTLANCSSECSTMLPRATLTVGICSPSAHSISLLRRSFGQDCTMALQRLTRLARGDILCANLTLPLLPSRNADETFFGIQWVYP